MDCDHSGKADLKLEAFSEVATFDDRPGLLMLQTRVFCTRCGMAFRFRHGGTMGLSAFDPRRLGEKPFVNLPATELCIRIEEAADEPRLNQIDQVGHA